MPAFYCLNKDTRKPVAIAVLSPGAALVSNWVLSLHAPHLKWIEVRNSQVEMNFDLFGDHIEDHDVDDMVISE